VDEFGKEGVLIVSNTSGAAGEEDQARVLEKDLGVAVMRHSTKVPSQVSVLTAETRLSC
jgi:hypothetical protein